MKNITELRKGQYEYNYKLYPYLPYTWFKARFYMEASAVLVYFLLKTKIKPNTVTIVYGLLGLLGGVLLAVPTNEAVFIAVVIFFSKGILDWSDGHLARIRGQTSVTGSILDSYGALLGALGFQMGLGFYVAQKSETILFYYLIPLIPLFYAGRLHSFAFSELFTKHITSEKIKEYRKKNPSNAATKLDNEELSDSPPKKYGMAYGFIRNFLDDRARTVDLVCLLILLEIFTSIFITWIIFLGFVTKQFVIFLASFCVVARSNWAEKQLKNKEEEISRVFTSNM